MEEELDEFPRATNFDELCEYLKMNRQLMSVLPKYITFPALRLKGTVKFEREDDLSNHPMIAWILENADTSKVALVYSIWGHVSLLPIDKLYAIKCTAHSFVFKDEATAVMFKLMFSDQLHDW